MNKNIFIYQARSGKIEFRGDFKKDTIWGAQKMIAKLFNVKRPAITKHLQNIFNSQELKEKSVGSILEHTADDNKVLQLRLRSFLVCKNLLYQNI